MNIVKILKNTALFVPLFFMSCHENINDSIEHNKTRVYFSVDDFENTFNSRTVVSPNEGYNVKWAKGDIVGIFPYEGYQEPFTIPDEQANSGTATFDGGYWALKNGLKYNAYYPFDKVNFESPDMKTKIPVDYKGQKQIGTSCTVGSHAFTYSDWATAGDGAVHFQFHHIGSLVIITLPIPSSTTYSSLTIETENTIIPIKGTYDLTSQLTNNEEPSFIADASSLSKSISVELVDFIGTAYTNATIYMMLPPVDLSSETLTLTLKATNGGSCVYSVPGQNVLKGKRTEYIGKPTNSTVTGTTYEWLIEQGILNADYAFDITLTGSTRLASAKVPNNSATLSQFASIIKSLKVTGDLNSTDIKFIRELSALEALDLSDANIIEGGESYYTNGSTNCTTISNVFPSYFMTGSSLTNLKFIALPHSVKKIDYSAFVDDFNNTGDIPNSTFALNHVALGENLEEISIIAFGCSITSIEIPKNVKSIGTAAFGYCPMLEAINVVNDNKMFKSIEGVIYQNSNTETNPKYTILNVCPPAKKTFAFPEELNITQINTRAFSDNIYLTSIVIPEGVTTLGGSIFARCSALKSVTIPTSVSTLSSATTNFWWKNTAMEKLHLKSETPPTWYFETGSESYQLPTTCQLHVPNTDNWSYSSTNLKNWDKYFTIVKE